MGQIRIEFQESLRPTLVFLLLDLITAKTLYCLLTICSLSMYLFFRKLNFIVIRTTSQDKRKALLGAFRYFIFAKRVNIDRL